MYVVFSLLPKISASNYGPTERITIVRCLPIHYTLALYACVTVGVYVSCAGSVLICWVDDVQVKLIHYLPTRVFLSCECGTVFGLCVMSI